MRRFGIGLLTSLFVWGPAAIASAQTATLPYDHVHLAAPDQAAAVEWYRKMFGGQTTPEGKDRLLFGKTRFIWMKAAAAQPSAGSAIDHIGFSFADLDAKMKEFQAAGVKIVTPVRDVPGLFKLGFIEDPWGVKIEVVQDPETLGFHHIHLRSADPAVSLAWYKARFGGEMTKLKNRIDALKFGDVWVLVQKADAAPAASAGHALDHVGWRVADLDRTLADLSGVKVLQGVTNLQLATGPIRYSFVEDPTGTKIELVQR